VGIVDSAEDAEVFRVATLIAERVDSLLKRRGLAPEDNLDDELSRDEPGLAAIYSASVRSRIASAGGHRSECVMDVPMDAMSAPASYRRGRT
jgi:hypothetical protein